ncbi:ParM/StbA family protein [Clostridium psychrophilum]|uniref:ParM/StbA family protein n=1 Tax=Clostridium psychrophilum TaxID=132926 RepID=UPI001C0DE4A3|nr:ParM/StbA family protein [Clostridium psychrophilum]MBU3180387.1 ParM/StbA family protein [Clostridium psychrophilum]
MSEIQYIGADLGRGFIKGYTEYEGESGECIFKSIIGDGRDLMDYNSYNDPIYLKVDGEDVFAGEICEKESFNKRYNFSDDKTSKTTRQLLFTLLNKLARSSTVKIGLGVPNKVFSTETFNEVKNAYKGKTIETYNYMTKELKKIYIEDIIIFRESDAALLHTINNHKDRVALNNKRLGMITLGFKTSELTYFEKGQKFNDKLSKTIEIGNRTVLDIIQDNLDKKGITKELSEIDTEKEYDIIKQPLYENLIESINQKIEMEWINHKDMRIFLGGGTSLNIKDNYIPAKFEKIEEPQMATVKGLFLVAKEMLK